MWCDLEDEVARILSDKGIFLEDEYDFTYIDIIPIKIQEGTINSVMVFGDRTIEFHIDEYCDAYNWSAFSSEVIEEVLNNLKEI